MGDVEKMRQSTIDRQVHDMEKAKERSSYRMYQEQRDRKSIAKRHGSKSWVDGFFGDRDEAMLKK